MKTTWINASAGTGKTTCLTNQCLSLLKQGIKPQNILCITFTNNAAQEMQDRIQNPDLPIKTIHSVAQHIVQSIHNITISRILDEYDQDEALRKATHHYFKDNPHAAETLSADYSYYYFLTLIKKVLYKTKTPVTTFAYNLQPQIDIDLSLIDHHDLYLTQKSVIRKKLAPHMMEDAQKVYHHTQTMNIHAWMTKNTTLISHINGILKHYLAIKQGYDFNDLILEAIELLNDPHHLYQTTKNIHHVLLDEAQDTSFHQWTLFKKIIEHAQSVFIVGDEKQSIYSFQDADPSYYLAFKDYMKSMSHTFEEKTLAVNYRSLQTIVDVAHQHCPHLHIPSQNTHRKAKGHHATLTHREHIVQLLNSKMILPSTQKPIEPKDIGLLFRKRDQVFQETLLFLKEHNIPTKASKKHLLQDESLIKELMHIINLQLYYPDDAYSMFFYERSVLKEKGVPMLFNSVSEMIVALFDHLPEDMFIALVNALSNLEAPTFYLLRDYLNNHPVYYEPFTEDNAVSLMTIHSAKGLQFPVVYLFETNQKEPFEPFLYDISTNTLYVTPPSDIYHDAVVHIRTMEKQKKEEENERLLYVAITRARDHFYFMNTDDA